MDKETMMLLNTIYEKISGDDEKKIKKLKIISEPLIDDGDITVDDLTEFLAYSKVRYDKLVVYLITKINKTKPEDTVALLYHYFKRFLTEQEIMINLDIVKEHLVNASIADLIDKAIYEVLSKSTDESVSTPAMMKLIKLKRETNEIKRNESYRHTDSCGSSSSIGTYRSSC